MASTSKQVGDADSELALNINEMLLTVPPLPTECCIYKVPVNIRSENEAAYTPKVVSIGPLHHGEEILKPMEAHKKRYLNAFLRRNPDITMEDCVRFLRGLEERTRYNYYEDQFIQTFSSNEFVTMMLLDGCFIVELFLLRLNPQTKNKYDPLFNSKSLGMSVIFDLMLLENQLPFFLLEQLFDCINGPNKVCMSCSFFEVVAANFMPYVRMDQTVHLKSTGYQVKHFVDYILNCYLPSEVFAMPASDNTKPVYLPSATELHLSGIKFKKGKSNSFLDIKFSNGVLEIPTLHFEDGTEYRFRNLIAMEQCHPGSTSYITDYMQLMDCLVNTPKDVALLRSCGIISNLLGSNEEVAQLVNKLMKGVFVNHRMSHYCRLQEDVSSYSNKRWNVWKARLRRDCCTNPWAILYL